MHKKILLNIPHSSNLLPNNFNKRLLINDATLKRELNILTDWYTDELFYNEDCEILIAKYSRLYCDIERFRNDKNEPMSKIGMGAIYENTTLGELLINSDNNYKKEVLSNYYDKYHDKLNSLTDNIINNNGFCIIIDCHSFSEKWVNILNKEEKRYPDICIGYDYEFCNFDIISPFEKIIEKYKYTHSLNYPFEGSIVPNKYYNSKDKRIISIMIEINKRLYMNEKNNEKNEEFSKVRNMLQEYIKLINDTKIII